MTPDLYHKMADLQAEHWWFSARRTILSKVIRTLQLGKDATILEIGCGTGGNLSMLRDHGNVWAIEHDQFSREHASQISGMDVADGALPDDLHVDRRFDLICLFDVLEHIENDTESLRAVSKLLEPGGVILLTVPAYPWLYSEHDRQHGHFRRYNLQEIYAKAELAGLRVDRGGYFNSLLFPVAMLRRLIERGIPGRLVPETDIPGQMINRLLRKVFELESHAITRFFFPFGLSAIAVLRRR